MPLILKEERKTGHLYGSLSLVVLYTFFIQRKIIIVSTLYLLFLITYKKAKGPIPLGSKEFFDMQEEVKRIIGSNVVVAHNVENDLQQVGLSGIRCAQTDAFGDLSGRHDPVEDAKEHMELAVS